MILGWERRDNRKLQPVHLWDMFPVMEIQNGFNSPRLKYERWCVYESSYHLWSRLQTASLKKGKHITGFVAETITKQLMSTGMSFLFIVADYASSPTLGVSSHVRVAFLVLHMHIYAWKLHTHMPISQAYCTQYKQALPCWNCYSFKFCKLAFQDLVRY